MPPPPQTQLRPLLTGAAPILVASCAEPMLPASTDQALGASDLEAVAVDAAEIEEPELHEQYLEVLPDTGLRVHVYTFVNGQGARETVAVDAERGAAIDLAGARAAEASALAARCGRVDRALCDAMAAAGGSTLPVVIWLVHAEQDEDRGLAQRDAAAFARARDAAIAARRATVARVVTGLESALGRSGLGRSRFAPVLTGDLSVAEIQAVASQPEVGAVMLGGREVSQDLAGSLTMSNWSNAPTYDGTGIPVGILELGRPDVVTDLPTLGVRDPTGATDAHARLVAGIIANTTATPGYANDATLYIANRMSTDTEIDDLDWALGAVSGSPTLVNNQSWHFTYERTLTTLSARDRYLDYLTRGYALFYSTAASNADARYVVHKGYNIVTVGAVYSNGLIVDGNAPAAEVTPTGCLPLGSSYVSTWQNGVPQELPHLVTDGGCVTAVGTTMAGTSFAAPGVTGMAAGLGELAPALLSWPEAMKAILVASPHARATFSPDGCEWRTSRPSGGGSCTVADGRDGTGIVDGLRARRMAGVHANPPTRHRWAHDFGYITRNDFRASSPHFFSTTYRAEGTPSCTPLNERMRVVLAWDSDASCTAGDASSCTDTLDMDLDILVYEEPGGALIGQSATTVNSYEHVDIPIRGSTLGCGGADWHYRIEVRLSNYSATAGESTYYGIAWHAY